MRIPNTGILTKTREDMMMEWLDLSWLEMALDRYYNTYNEKYLKAYDSIIDFIKNIDTNTISDEKTRRRYSTMKTCVY